MSTKRRGDARRRWAAGLFTVGMLWAASACSVDDQAPVSQSVPAVGPAGENTVPDADSTFIAECTSDSRIRRPTSYVLACADGNEFLENLTWSSWGEATATATGTLVFNDCSPSCAEGKDIEVPAQVVADELVTGDDIATYRRLTVTSTGESGVGQANQEVYHLPGPDSDRTAGALADPSMSR